MLAGQLALVTGGSRGIGSAIVEKLAAEGATVVFTYNTNQESAELLTQQLISRGLQVHAHQLDITSREQVEALLEYIYSNYGLPDILVNNAGITRDRLFVQMTFEDWTDVIHTNLSGMFHLTRALSYKMLLNEKHGSLINISSVSAIAGTMGQTNYSAAKAGMIGFTKSLARELGKYHIRVNAVAPGYIQTDMLEEMQGKGKKEMLSRIPLRRIGSAQEAANVVLFLASSLSSYITGTTITVDGGLTS